jgi:hypothetical protein
MVEISHACLVVENHSYSKGFSGGDGGDGGDISYYPGKLNFFFMYL